MSSQASLNVVSALANRAQQEQEYQEEWEDSIKPSTVTGNGVIKQLGSKPLASDQILTNTTAGTGPIAAVQTAGGIVGDWVPRFEREEAVQTVRKKFVYSAIFTREVPGGRTQWTDLEMLQRQFNLNQPLPLEPLPMGPNYIQAVLNDRIFYYWNGSSIQELFKHTSSEKIASGVVEYGGSGPYAVLFSTAALKDLENGMQKRDRSINKYIFNEDDLGGSGAYFLYQNSSLCYILITKVNPLSPRNLSASLQIWNADQGTNVGKSLTSRVEVNGEDYDLSLLYVGQDAITNLPGGWEFVTQNTSSSLYLPREWELYRIYSHGGYFTTTQRGTAFAHITNGNADDEKTRIKYFYNSGIQPRTLRSLSLNQSESEKYWQSSGEPERKFPEYDWRSHWITSDIDDVENYSQLSFSGILSDAIQYTDPKTKGIRFSTQFAVQDLFASNNGVDISAINIKPTSYNSSTGSIDYEDKDQFQLNIPSINLSVLGEEGVDYYLEDICTPDIFCSPGDSFPHYITPRVPYLFPFLSVIQVKK